MCSFFLYLFLPSFLQAVALPEGEGEAHFLSPEAAPRLQAAVELCWLTCAASRLNGEELTRSGGVRWVLRCSGMGVGWGGLCSESPAPLHSSRGSGERDRGVSGG